MKGKNIKLSQYAKENCITYKTAWKRFQDGMIENAFKDSLGNIIVKVIDDVDYSLCVTYAIVSTTKQKDDSNRQENRLINYVNQNNLKLVKKYKEVGSWMNDNRAKLIELLNDDSWNTLITENKDRLNRFGFNYIETLLNKMGKKVIVVNQNEDIKEDLINDLVSIIYSFSARMYGLRRKKNKEEVLEFLRKNNIYLHHD